MKRTAFVLFLLLMFPLLSPGAGPQTVPMTDLMKPDAIFVDNGKIFITDLATVSIYSLKDFKRLKVFGKSGEGPMEFKVMLAAKIGLRLSLPPDRILVNSIAKVTLFDRNGKYLSEHKVKSNVQEFKPLGDKGDKYVGYGQLRENNIFYLTINLYDSQFNPVKEIYRKDWYAQTEKEFNPMYMAFGVKRRALYHTSTNRCFVEGENGEIKAFDKNGKALFTIKHDYGKVPFTDTHKKEILAKYDKNPRLKQMVQLKGKFPAYFPFRYFTVADGKVYVLSFKKGVENGEKSGEKSAFYIFDIDGKFLNEVMVPFNDIDLLIPYPYTIAGGKLYQLIEDEDAEEWQLRIHALK